MYDRILVPYDGSDGAAAILYHAAEIAHWADARISVLFVADTNRDSVTVVIDDVVDGLVEQGEQILTEAGETLDSLGVDYRTDVIQGDPPRTISEYADRYDHDLIVMPTHGDEGLSKYLSRSVAEAVVGRATVPVVVSRMQPDEQLTFPYETVVCATDGSTSARDAADHGLALAAALGASVHAVSVVESRGLGDTDAVDDDRASEAVEAIRTMAADYGVEEIVTAVEDGSPPEAIDDYVDAVGAHAVVMGTTGAHGVGERVFGSIAQRTARVVSVPVLVVPEARD
ncbi:MAG: universal stress protein [Halohasta sp.]